MTYIFCSSRDQKIKNITNLELEQKGIVKKWDLLGVLRPLPNSRTPWDPKNL